MQWEVFQKLVMLCNKIKDDKSRQDMHRYAIENLEHVDRFALEVILDHMELTPEAADKYQNFYVAIVEKGEILDMKVTGLRTQMRFETLKQLLYEQSEQ